MPIPEYCIQPIQFDREDELQQKIDHKTKPLGSLGQLEQLAFRISKAQKTLNPSITHPCMMVFAADHGLSDAGISPYPKEVTTQMVLNFLNGGAAINVFSKSQNLQLKVINAGIAGSLPSHPDLIDLSIAPGTRNSLNEIAMDIAQVELAFKHSHQLIQSQIDTGTNLFLFGEMGIGNTSAASLLMHEICHLDLDVCIGRGTGMDDQGMQHKLKVLKQVTQKHVINRAERQPFDTLACFGGFEIAMICGAMLSCAEQGMLFVVDGFIATSALLVAHAAYPHILDYAIFSHCSDETGHRAMLDHLKAEPLLNLGLRLGEGTGAALAFPLLQASVDFLNQMASFESAAVSQRD